MYFRKFPKFEYDAYDNGASVQMTDITRRVRFRTNALLNSVSFDFYDVTDGETPEMVAHKIYGDTKYHWIVLVANNIRDVYTDWPMSVERFEKFVHSKYDNVDDIQHYVYTQHSGDTKFTIELPNESATDIPVDATPITNIEYEEAEQEKKRRIKLVSRNYIGRIKDEFDTIMQGK